MKFSLLLFATFMVGVLLLIVAPSIKDRVGYWLEQASARTGMATGFVTLLRAYQGYAAGTIVSLPASTEATLIAAGQATTSAGPVTPGAISTNMTEGMAAVAIGASSVVITNPLITPSSRVGAVVSQAAADGTALRVERVVPGAGLVTIYVTANATAATQINWWLHSAAQSNPT